MANMIKRLICVLCVMLLLAACGAQSTTVSGTLGSGDSPTPKPPQVSEDMADTGSC